MPKCTQTWMHAQMHAIRDAQPENTIIHLQQLLVMGRGTKIQNKIYNKNQIYRPYITTHDAKRAGIDACLKLR